MGWFTSNWIWIVLIGAMVAMHLRHGGQGGHGGHGESHGRRGGGDALRSDDSSQPEHAHDDHTVQSPTVPDAKASTAADKHRC